MEIDPKVIGQPLPGAPSNEHYLFPATETQINQVSFPAGVGCPSIPQQGVQIFSVAPVLPVAPNPPTQPYNLVPGGKLNKEAICREFVVVETKIHDLEHNIKILHGENARLRAEVLKSQAEMELRFRETEKKFEERFVALKHSAAEEAAVRNSGVAREEESDSSNSSDVEMVNEAAREAKMSVEASNHSKIKAPSEQQLVHFMYCKFLGVSKLSEKGDFPIIVDDPDDLPFVDGSEDVRQVRFHWDKPNKFPANHASIMTIVSFTRSHGSNYVSEAAPYLEKIKQGDLEARFITKYQALQKVFRGTTGKKSTKPGGELSRAMRDNRARGKLEMRERKRNSLPADSQWRLAKYNHAFTLQQMSDDEDTYEDGKLTRNVYTSRAPTSRSMVMKELFEAIDAAPDVRPSSQFAKRIRGEPKELPPPATKTLNGRARRWMIDPNWLSDHADHDLPSRIADNGRLWGDANDPEEMVVLLKKSAQDKAELKLKRKRMNMTVKESGDGDGKKGRKRVKKGKEKEGSTLTMTASRAGGSRLAPITPETIDDSDSDSMYE